MRGCAVVVVVVDDNVVVDDAEDVGVARSLLSEVVAIGFSELVEGDVELITEEKEDERDFAAGERGGEDRDMEEEVEVVEATEEVEDSEGEGEVGIGEGVESVTEGGVEVAMVGVGSRVLLCAMAERVNRIE